MVKKKSGVLEQDAPVSNKVDLKCSIFFNRCYTVPHFNKIILLNVNYVTNVK